MGSIMEEPSVAIEKFDNYARFVINRPKNLNALNSDVLQSIILGLEEVLKDETCRAIIITGIGEKAFVAGADIASMTSLGPRAIADYVELGQRVMSLIEKAPVPVVAAVNGFALGGGMELALACDLIVAADTAKFGQPEVNLGIIPGFGGTQRIIQRAGVGTARRLVYTGEIISAEEALRLGLVDKVVDAAEIHSSSKEIVKVILSKGPLAVAKAKEVIYKAGEAVLLAGLRSEVNGFLELFGTADREEGMTAFLEKREPKFTGR